MNILAPVDRPGEIPILAKVGANEFFCGYNPEEWIKKYNNTSKYKSIQISINKREAYSTNVKNIESLKKMVEEANSCKSKLFIALNAFYYPDEAYEFFDNYFNEVISIGIHGVIIADLGLANYFRKKYPKVYLILSCVTQVENKMAAKFFQEMKIDRLTFPHHITIKEIEDISNSTENIDYECFVLEGRCIYDLGRCHALHSAGLFCEDQWNYSYFPCKKEVTTYEDIKEIKSNENSYKNWTNTFISKHHQVNGWRSVTCGICAILGILNMKNIKTLKIAGRGINLAEKIIMVRFVKKALTIAQKGNAIELKEYAIKIFGIPELCQEKTRCLMPSKKY